MYTLILAFVVIVGVGVITNYYEVTDNTLVISFFGILATFVVIGNYSQVHNLTENTNKNIENLEKKLSEIRDKTLSEIDSYSLKNELKRMSDSLFDKTGKSQLSNIQTRLGLLERTTTQSNQNILLYMQLRDILYLEIGEQKTLIKDIILDLNTPKKRKVRQKGHQEIVEAYVSWSPEKGIIFKDMDGNPINDIVSVASKPFDKTKVDKIIRNLLNIVNSSKIQ